MEQKYCREENSDFVALHFISFIEVPFNIKDYTGTPYDLSLLFIYQFLFDLISSRFPRL